MAVNNYVSIKEIIAKVYADAQIGEENFRVNDVIVWTGEALKKIGAFPYYTYKITGVNDGATKFVPVLEIKDHRAKIPCDMVHPIQLAASENANGPFVPCTTPTGSFDVFGVDAFGSNSGTGAGNITFPSDIDNKVAFVSNLFSISEQNAFAKINSDPNIATILDAVFPQDGTYGMTHQTVTDFITASVQAPYIHFNIRNGYAVMAYKAMPTDCDGYPLVPDDEDTKEAIFWYLEMKTLYPLWKRGVIRDAVYANSVSEWKHKKLASYSNLVMPSAMEMDAFRNVWLRLIPDITPDKTFFSKGAVTQKINLNTI